MWSASQPRAGRVHQGKTQVWSRTAIDLAVPARHHGRVDGVVGGGVEDGFHDHLAGVAAPSLSWPGVTSWLPCSSRAVRASWERWTYSTILRGWFRTGATRRPRPREGRRRAGAGRAHRPPCERRTSRDSVGAEVLELGGDRLDRRLELEGVGDVELAVDGQGAVVGVHLPGLDGEVPAVRVFEATGLGFGGHAAADRLVDQPVQLDGPIRCAVGATCRSTNAAASIDSRRVFSATRRASHGRRSPSIPASTRAGAGSGARGRGRRTASPHRSTSPAPRRTR